MVEFHNKDMTQFQWWIDWFGYFFGRELGTNKEPHRKFTDNPNDIVKFINRCHEEKRPCWISVQPFSAYDQPCVLEKLFFDFDYHKAGGKRKAEIIDKEVVAREVRQFVNLVAQNWNPLIVETRKGYHVYIFLAEAIEFGPKQFDYMKRLYTELQNLILFYLPKSKFADKQVVGDLKRLARVPMTRHETSGEFCQIVDLDLKPTKVRDIDWYRSYGIRESLIKQAAQNIRDREEREHIKQEIQTEERERQVLEKTVENLGLGWEIRPCFREKWKKAKCVMLKDWLFWLKDGMLETKLKTN